MRILFAVLVSGMALSVANAQAPDSNQFPLTVKVISETKESIDKGSTTTTRRVSPVIPCSLNIAAFRDKLQSTTKSNVQSYYQAKAQIGDTLYTINGRSGGPGVPFGTFKAKISNQYMDIYIVNQHGPYVLGFEIVGAEKLEPQPSTAPLNAAAAPAPPETAKGGVNVSSNPVGADVSVDGDFVGNSPASLKLAPGKHTIAVKLSGYKNWSREITVQAGSEVQLTANLEK